jgi:hypothetical protein
MRNIYSNKSEDKIISKKAKNEREIQNMPKMRREIQTYQR